MEKIIIELKEVREKQIITDTNIKNIDKNLTELSSEFKNIMKLLNQNLVLNEKIKNIEESLNDSKKIGKESVIKLTEEINKLKEETAKKTDIKELKDTADKYKFAFVTFAFSLTAGIVLLTLKTFFVK